MLYRDFISPKEVEIGGRKFAVSKIPAIEAQTSIYPAVARAISNDGILGITMLPTQTVKDILGRTAVMNDSGNWEELNTDTAINRTFSDIGHMHLLIGHMVKENFGFFTDGSLQKVLEAAGMIDAETESES